jgi:hypothetical protein
MKTKTLFTAGALIAAALIANTGSASAETVWAAENINRPLTMPAGSFYGGALLTTLTFDAWAAGVQGGYGLSDELELYATYGLGLDPSSNGAGRVGAGYAFVRGAMEGKLELVGRADIGYNVEGSALDPLVAGIQGQYTLAPKFALVMPATHLSIALDGDTKPMTFSVPVGFLFQAAPTFYLQLDTTLATLKIKDSANAFIFADVIPMTLTAAYNSKILDAGVFVSTDLKNSPGDAYVVGVFARYYGGV